MITTNREMAGGSARGTPEPRSWAKPPGLALLSLALVGLFQAGCQFDGCTGCGFGSRISNGVQALGANVANGASRVFHHKSAAAGCSTCGDGVEEGVIMEPGLPMAPGAMVVPGPGTMIPAPPIESAPSQLEPIPPTSGSSTIRTAPGTNRSNYEASLPRNSVARARKTEVDRAIHSTPEPIRSTYAGASPSDLNDPFANVPPVDVPVEVTRKAASIPTPTNKLPAVATEPAPAPAAMAAPVTGNTGKSVTPTPAETVSAAEGAASSPVGRSAPGIRRSASVAPSVGGGSAPSIDGLDWLKEKGYRTFLDLRSSSEIDPNFVEAVNDHGMFYLSLPIVAERLNASRLARFDELIAQTANRPLYFCDTDGTRAGLAWYIHLRAVDGDEAHSAFQKAEEIGLTEVQAKLAETYLAIHTPQAKKTTAPMPTQTTQPESTKPGSALPTSCPSPAPAPVVAPTPAPAPTPPMLPGENRPQASAQPGLNSFRDPATWRPIAALLLTGIGVPLAYWSKSAISGVRLTRRRASLPGPAKRSLDAPAGSDA